MKEKLLPIQIQLLDRLNRTKEPVSSQFLANSLGVSSKTIRKNLSQLNLALSDQGAAIASKTGSGYWLIIEDLERFEHICHALNSLPDAQGQRVFEHYLLNHSVKAIAAAEGVTERAINAAIQRGLENMKKYLEKVL